MLEWIGKLPTTQARVCITLAVFAMTGIRYVLSGPTILLSGQIVPGWQPSYEWLGFLLLMSGVDAAQFVAKRATDANYVAAKQGATLPTPPADPPVTT